MPRRKRSEEPNKRQQQKKPKVDSLVEEAKKRIQSKKKTFVPVETTITLTTNLSLSPELQQLLLRDIPPLKWVYASLCAALCALTPSEGPSSALQIQQLVGHPAFLDLDVSNNRAFLGLCRDLGRVYTHHRQRVSLDELRATLRRWIQEAQQNFRLFLEFTLGNDLLPVTLWDFYDLWNANPLQALALLAQCAPSQGFKDMTAVLPAIESDTSRIGNLPRYPDWEGEAEAAATNRSEADPNSAVLRTIWRTYLPAALGFWAAQQLTHTIAYSLKEKEVGPNRAWQLGTWDRVLRHLEHKKGLPNDLVRIVASFLVQTSRERQWYLLSRGQRVCPCPVPENTMVAVVPSCPKDPHPVCALKHGQAFYVASDTEGWRGLECLLVRDRYEVSRVRFRRGQ